jgi:hypothetical protein
MCSLGGASKCTFINYIIAYLEPKCNIQMNLK